MFHYIKQEDAEKNQNSEFGINVDVQKAMANGNTQFIIDLTNSKELKFTTYTLPTAALHIAAKFFHIKCYINYDRFLVLAACFFLAAKLKDMEVKLKNLCFAFHSVMSKITHSTIPVDQSIIQTIKDQIIVAQSEVLRTLEYETQFVSPHEYVKKYCDLSYGERSDKNEKNGSSMQLYSKIFHTTKILILDSNRVQCSLYFSPLIIFLSCFLIASRYENQKPYMFAGVKIHCKSQNPTDQEMYHGWLQMISMNEGQPIKPEDILQCIKMINSLLEMCNQNSYQN